MRQRLGLSAALLGDPGVLVLDEPTNGLDPEGIVWLRTLLRTLAGEGRTIFLSSHLMSEMAMVADHLVLIGQGRLIGDISVAELIAMASGPAGAVRTLEEAYLELTHRVEDFRGRGPSRSAS
jgi:ABC-2 type transport system ATP-binding protein